MFCGVLGGLALAGTSRFPTFEAALWLLAATMIVLRLLANMLDGMVAVSSGKTSSVGELFNEVPDRVSDAAVLIGLGYATGGDVLLGCWATIAAILTAYVRAIGKVAGASQDYSGPFAKQQRMALVIVLCVVMATLPSAWQPAWGDPPWRLPAVALAVLTIGAFLTAIRRLLRVARQLRSRP